MSPPLHIDWPQVLADLSAAGLGMKRLAKQMGVGWSTVRGWKRGSEPSHADGEVVLIVWTNTLGKTREDAPKAPWFGRMQRLFR